MTSRAGFDDAAVYRHVRPQNVTLAVIIVWLWIGFLIVSGFFEASIEVPQLQDALALVDVSMAGRTLFLLLAGTYAFFALTMVGVAIKLNQGSSGARFVLLVSFLFDFAMTAFTFDYKLSDFILTPINIGMQAYALWLVFSRPGRFWFQPKNE